MAEWYRTGLDDARLPQLQRASRRTIGQQLVNTSRTQSDCDGRFRICGRGQCANPPTTSQRNRRTETNRHGNLSRALVEKMCGIMQWPGYDKDELFGFHKVINEPDFLPLHFIRILTQAAKLLRTYRGKLVATPLGRKILDGEQHGALQALLFHVAFWRLNLGYFDRYAVHTWPQDEVGVVLWSLSASAHDWLPRETLTRLCARPVSGVLVSQWDFGSSAMEARILRPLWWFGVLEARSQEESPTEFVGSRLYRKVPLFDRFLQFNVQIEESRVRH